VSQYKVVHYINQFFGQVGSEEMADYPAEKREGPVGPGIAFTMAFGDQAVITATIVCGDSWYNENLDLAKKTVLDMVREEKPDLFIAGPAFNAGRYGVACGSIADAVQTELGIPAVTGMYVENPGADMYREKVYIVATGDNAAGMRRVVPVMAGLGLKLVKRQEIGASIEEGYLPNGVRKNFFDQKRGSLRAIEMLLNKLHDKPFVTEYPMPSYDRVPPGPAIRDLSRASIALVTSGGIVPKGNPDHIESSSATRYGSYHIAGVDDLTSETYETAHGGYDPVYANQDADRIVPVDVLRQFEKEGKIGKLHDWFYSTVGNGTSVASSKRFAMEITEKLLAQGVDAVILTST
jgi:betaine reductase